jgi:DNA repair protein RecN (Recombination protein N)
VLSRLHVVHYALIQEVEIDFGKGLNIITGETGAGKSILIGALGLVLGGRANADVIRTGQEKCIVEAVFEFPKAHPSLVTLEREGIEVEDGQLILRREVNKEGRSRCFANGLSIPVRSLQQVGKLLVDLHGQHDHQSLLDASRHISFLDGFAGLIDRVDRVGEQFDRVDEVRSQLRKLERAATDRSDRRELLTFQLDEIGSATPATGEDEALEVERSRLENAERLIDSATQLEQMLYEGDESIVDRLGSAQRTLGEVVRADATLEKKAEELEAIRFEVEELSRFFSGYSQDVEHNPERLTAVVERIELLSRLKSKYGGDLKSVLAYVEEARRELEGAESNDAEQARLSEELAKEEQTFGKLCLKLSKDRAAASARLSESVEASLSELGMPDVCFEIRFVRSEDANGIVLDGTAYVATREGIESAEFYLSTNPGETPRPLVRVASGGEISRIMLALKTVLSQTDSVQVLIFDEIDVGISGRIAEVVGRRLKHLADGCQTVSITHLPQIAKMADRHFAVRKETDGEKTETYVARLEEQDRVEELAKLLGGEEISSLTLEHAKEMLAATAPDLSKPGGKQKASA